MDDTDRELIAALREDGRASVATLARKLGVSRGTATNRLRQLETSRVILGYSVRLQTDAMPDQVKAWMSVKVEGTQTRAVIDRLLGEAGIVALHDTNGRWDLLAELRVASNAELSALLDRVRRIKGIVTTETDILLATYR